MTPPARPPLIPVEMETLRERFKMPLRIAASIAILALLIWLATGIYTVNPGEQGVIRRFGKMVAVQGPGLRYHLPYPLERVDIVNMEVVRRIEIGFRSTPSYRVVPLESLMLTHDQNIVDVHAIVQYRIKSPGDYLFRVADPERALQDSTEVSLRSVIGRTTIEDVLTTGRTDIESQGLEFLQTLLDTYRTGLMVTELKLQVVDPPEAVKDAFHEVVRAREDRERLINEALGYQEDVLPKARGQAEQMLREAEAYQAQREIQAQGDAAKFMSILEEYTKAPDITKQRLYIEALQRVLPKAKKIILGSQIEANLLPFLSLLRQQMPPATAVPPPPVPPKPPGSVSQPLSPSSPRSMP